MLNAALAACILNHTAETDPYLLPIPTAAKITVGPGLSRGGRPASMKDVVESARGFRYVCIGESHDVADHHQFQADVIRALVVDGRRVTVGFEMFTRPNQANLNPWTLGWWSESEFIERANWKKEWGFDFALYRPIFEAVKDLRLPMAALNVPRDWVRAVGKGGANALTADQKVQIPEINVGNKEHRRVFDALMGGHPPTGPMGENIYAAQVLWDTGMADTAARFGARTRHDPRSVVVILAGVGHVMYGQGINFRLQNQTGERSLNLICLESNQPRAVAAGLGDYIFVSPEVVRADNK